MLHGKRFLYIFFCTGTYRNMSTFTCQGGILLINNNNNMRNKIIGLVLIWVWVMALWNIFEPLFRTEKEQELYTYNEELKEQFPNHEQFEFQVVFTQKEIQDFCWVNPVLNKVEQLLYTTYGCFSPRKRKIVVIATSDKRNVAHEFGHVLGLKLEKKCNEDVTSYASKSAQERGAEVFAEYMMWTLTDECWTQEIETLLIKK